MAAFVLSAGPIGLDAGLRNVAGTPDEKNLWWN
jgi:hypothetical protein